ncbi:hypothetical protein AAG607_00950 [Citromicrobium bathyomarinum]|uniref:hypothetical protein n=1 Tax=Citromicrobium bathyomarinum TaxID=72174 RepID=UPI00315AF9C2
MTVQWNVKHDLDLLRRIYKREIEDRCVDNSGSAARTSFTVLSRENNPLIADISLPVQLCRGVKGELTSTVSTTEMSIDDIVDLAREFAEGAEQLDSQRKLLLEEVAQLRSYLGRRLRSLRAKGLRISGKVGLGSIGTHCADDIRPLVTLHFPGEDLRPGSFCFIPEGQADIADCLDELIDDLSMRSDKLDMLDDVDAAAFVCALVYDALEECEGGAIAALARILADPDHVQCVTDTSGKTHTVYWDKGVLTGTITLSEGVRLIKGSIHFDAMPCEASEVEIGSQLGTVIAFPCLAEIYNRILWARGAKGEKGQILFTAEPKIFYRKDMTV